MGKGIFVTGTGTDVGKTYTSGLLVRYLIERNYSCAYYKAAMSGNRKDEKGRIIAGDSETVKKLSGTNQSIDEMCKYVYENPFSPHLAAAVEGNPVNLDVIKADYEALKKIYDYTVMEGSGGIVCPIVFDEKRSLWLSDIINLLDIKCIIVADAGLGAINGTVLTTEYMKNRGIEVVGIILNRYDRNNMVHRDNMIMCQEATGVKVIAYVEEDGRRIISEDDSLIKIMEEL